MSKIDTTIHDVTRVNVEVVKAVDYSYTIVHVFTNDGQDFEYTIYPVKGESIVTTFGDANC